MIVIVARVNHAVTMNEVELINTFFSKKKSARTDVIIGIGDDAAILRVPADHDLVVTMDTLNSGIHFPENTSAFDIAYKAVMVNLSDLAAMGAQPAWATLSLSLPHIDESWLAEFSRGLFTVLDRYRVSLVGGDTNRGPLSVTLQLHGFVPREKSVLRSGAQLGDSIYVSGELGTAAFALQALQKKINLSEIELATILPALNRPEAKVELGLMLRDVASSAIDISDGLSKDLHHILHKSGVGAVVELDKLPINPILTTQLPLLAAYQLALSGGDDYQLCFTVPEARINELQPYLESHCITCIGKIVAGSTLFFRNAAGEAVALPTLGFQHF
jgi:thiamine-monophosphate kinase